MYTAPVDASFQLVTPPSERKFGFSFAIVFAALAARAWWTGRPGAFAVLSALSVSLLVITASAPRLLRAPNRIWFRIGLFLSRFMSPIVIGAMFILIVTIPFGVQAFKLASFSLWPFGRTVVKKRTAGGGSVIGNVLWLLLAGWWIALGHLVTALALAVTIIGLPLAWANVKLVPVALWPFGREIVSADDVSVAAFGER